MPALTASATAYNFNNGAPRASHSLGGQEPARHPSFKEKSMTDNIPRKVIVITGASSGMGEAAARHLASKGASVVLGARRADRLEALAADIVDAGGKAAAVVTDVTKRADLQKLVDTAVVTYGRIDVLINNAAIMPLSPLERLKVDEWDQRIDVNLKGVLYGIAAALPYMKEHVSSSESIGGTCSSQ
jgi:NADP-dependent 3-hydroxy acid dehydrogenase YdfG